MNRHRSPPRRHRPRPAGTARPRRGSDRGSASIWVLATGLVLLAAGLAGATVGAAHVAQHRAQAAADLGALAGAARAGQGEPAACARAAELVVANGARLTRCTLVGLDLTITVQVTPALATGFGGPATAAARAGPVRADDSRSAHIAPDATTGHPRVTAPEAWAPAARAFLEVAELVGAQDADLATPSVAAALGVLGGIAAADAACCAATEPG